MRKIATINKCEFTLGFSGLRARDRGLGSQVDDRGHAGHLSPPSDLGGAKDQGRAVAESAGTEQGLGRVSGEVRSGAETVRDDVRGNFQTLLLDTLCNFRCDLVTPVQDCRV